MDGITAVLLFEEGQTQLLVPVERLPPASVEGSWLLVRMENGEFVEADLDPEKTQEIKERIRSKRALLLERMARRGRKAPDS